MKRTSNPNFRIISTELEDILYPMMFSLSAPPTLNVETAGDPSPKVHRRKRDPRERLSLETMNSSAESMDVSSCEFS